MINVVLTIVPPLLRPVTGTPHNFEHLIIFLVTGAAFGLGYPRREIILCTSAILFSAVFESSKLMIAGRHARLRDFLVDVALRLLRCLSLFASSQERDACLHDD